MILPFINFGSTSIIVSVSTANPYYDPNVFFFLQTIPAFIDVQGLVILLILALGVLLLIPKFVRKIRDKKNSFDGLKLNNRAKKIKWTVFVFLVIIFLGSFGKIFYMVSELLFFVMAYLFYDLTKNLKLNMDISYIVFGLVYGIFHFPQYFCNQRYQIFRCYGSTIGLLYDSGIE